MNNIFGRVIKKKYKKIVVVVKKFFFLPIYKKRIFFYSKIIAYDMYNETNLGDYVMLRKTRPLSKTLFWVLSKILEKVRLI
ncbi:MAG: 30S ribosomal protein S17 [Candidatus Carsonella ruddii]|nr:MAG: 30S ribosomal protein S17 [Candidatus Carsonella ruddii]